MAEIYIGFVDTPGLFAFLIRKVIRQRYVHVVLGFDSGLEEAYSVGRRFPEIPLIAGFEKEDRRRILNQFPTARYQICRIRCTEEQRNELKLAAERAYHNRTHYHYTILGLPFLLAGKAFYQKNHYTCSSWLACVTQEAGVYEWDRHFSLVTPREVYEAMGKDSLRGELVFEGTLEELVNQRSSSWRTAPAGVLYR